MDNNLNVTGQYFFYEDGKEIYRSKNILTKFGKRYITQYLAGKSTSNLKDIALGVGSTAATINDTQLEFEFYKSVVNMSSVDIQTSQLTGESTYGIVYKSTVPVDVAGVISEVGLFPSVTFGSTDYAGNSISTFENNQEWYDSNKEFAQALTSPEPKIGTYYISMGATASQSKNYFYNFNLDISGYSSNDSLTLAYYQSDLNLDYVFVRTYDSNDRYYEIRYPSNNSIGYKIRSLTLNNLYTSGYGNGTPDNESIVKISVGVKAKSSGSTNVLFDGLRINDEDAFRSDYGLISRSVLSTPIVKTLGKQMDIEYRLGINF